MPLKSLRDTLLPQLFAKEFGKQIIDSLDQGQSVSVKGFVGSSLSLFVAELAITQNKTILYLVPDKEAGLYASSELEELLGLEKVLYFPPSHLDPYQLEKIQNA